MITTRADQRCEACGRGQDRESGRWLEAHERWAYDEAAAVQSLRRLICLCTDCHTATHFGLARIHGKDAAALRHLCAVTGMPSNQARQHVDTAFALWTRRSRVNWSLDLSLLTDIGIAVAEPPSARERGNVAGQTLGRL